MAYLLIRCGEKQLGDYPIESEVTTIGRGKDNTLYLEDASVSRRHARIKKEKSKYVIEDLKSSNGTLVNGKRVSSQTLRADDKIELGRYALIFQERPTAVKGDETSLDKKGRPFPVSELAVGPRLVVTKGTNIARQFPLNSQEISIGRTEGNDIVLPDDTISREHAKIMKKEGKIILADSGSQNGTFVNGKKIKEKELEAGDEITIGSIIFKFMPEERAGAPGKEAEKTALKRRLKKRVLVAVSALAVLIMLLRFALPSKDQAAIHLRQGRDFYNLSQWKEAIAELERALILNPQSREATEWLRKSRIELSVHTHLELGMEHFDSGNWAQAAWQMNEVLKIRPNREEAKIYLRKIRGKVSLEEIFKEAVRYGQAGDWARGIEKLEGILSIDPEHLGAKRYLKEAREELVYINLYARGVELFEVGEYLRSLKELSKIPESNRHYSKAQDYIARAEKKLQAKEHYRSGMAFYRIGEVKKARGEFRQALNLDAGNLEVQGALARMEEVTRSAKRAEQFSGKGMVIEAAQEWQRLLSREGDSQNYFHRLALNELEELKPKLTKVAEQHFARGLLYEEKEKLREARAEYSLVLQAQPGHAEARRHLERIETELTEKVRRFYERGIIFEQWGRREEAKKNFQQVLDLAPSDSEYYLKARKKLQKYE